MAIDRDRWRRAEELFHAALARPQEDRVAFLDEASAEEADLRREVDLLLASDGRAALFLESPAFVPACAAPAGRGSLVGRLLGTYRLLSFIGAGGMGEVYRAHDGKLGRDVAIKTLPPEFSRDAGRLARFHREARTLATLNHPNIAAIYGLEESDGLDYLVLELVDGEALRGPLDVRAALRCACQVASALEAAHGHGIIHRDLKPANIRLTPDGRVKVLDFGVAKAGPSLEDTPEPQVGAAAGTLSGLIVGTPGYMSPEQARGAEVDHRADIWAFGCLCYELLSGARAFPGETDADTMAAVLERQPDWDALPAGTPREARILLRHCLEKEASARPGRMADVRTALEDSLRPPGWRRAIGWLRQPRYAVATAALLALLSFAGARLFREDARVRWVREQAVPAIVRLQDAGDYRAASRLLRRAESIVPDDLALHQASLRTAMPMTVTTTPPGAEIWATGFAPDDEDWVRLGTTPFTVTRLPIGFYRVRVEKRGFETIHASGEVRGGSAMEFVLDPAGSLPPGMVRVSAGIASVSTLDDARVGAFVIDRYEVTNRQFRAFVDRGGYRMREYWKEAFTRDGRTLPWDEAMRAFRDSTGRPGPSTWIDGEYPGGHDDDPVGGVSWFEAAAYAEFAGKRLPTIYHWQRAASPGWFSEILEFSNFHGTGPAPVGSNRGLGAYGTLDMAGNVKEWCSNEVSGKRFTRGGAWNQAVWMFSELDGRSPWDRSKENGFRCMRDGAPDPVLDAPVRQQSIDRRGGTPVTDEAFDLLRSLYAYDAAPLDARMEGAPLETTEWRRETVSFASAAANERITAHFYVPKHATPPYQAVVYANPGMALRLPSPEPSEERIFEFIVKSGRVFLNPALKGYYHRRYPAPAAGPNDSRDRLLAESKDFRRCLDYLASRADVDRARLGVFGLSRGANLVPILATGDDRLKTAVLFSVGLTPKRLKRPEADPFNFLPHFTVPTLMASGLFDFWFPVETSQRPMLALLGAREQDKRLIQWEGGHGDLAQHYAVLTREALAWFDRYLGPVK
jgi:eukaryotic-like serine/threonine-protein kinase